MLEKKCTYSITEEIEGNKKKVEGLKGVICSGIIQKETSKGTFSMIWVADEETGELREVFAQSVKLSK